MRNWPLKMFFVTIVIGKHPMPFLIIVMRKRLTKKVIHNNSDAQTSYARAFLISCASLMTHIIV